MIAASTRRAGAHLRQKVLITGGSGYIGSNLVKHMATVGYTDLSVVTRAGSLSATSQKFNDMGLSDKVKIVTWDDTWPAIGQYGVIVNLAGASIFGTRFS